MPDRRVTVRLFGSLHALQRERGLPTTVEIDLPGDAVSGEELAALLDMPLDRIEGLFCNRTVYPVSHLIRPGDRVAFVPKGTPGPHRFFLGLYAAGKGEENG